MEHRPNMTSRPPAVIESAVGVFVPPLAREHLLGDLAERYTSPGRYLHDALSTVPAVVVSQIRRTSFFPLWPMIGLGLAYRVRPGRPGVVARSGDTCGHHAPGLHVPGCVPRARREAPPTERSRGRRDCRSHDPRVPSLHRPVAPGMADRVSGAARRRPGAGGPLRPATPESDRTSSALGLAIAPARTARSDCRQDPRSGSACRQGPSPWRSEMEGRPCSGRR